jgi:hypothetical protein
MKATFTCAGALLGMTLAASLADAGPYLSPVFCTPLPPAPDTCRPGFYVQGPAGMVYGPNYYLMPPTVPYIPNIPPAKCGPQPIPGYPSHPYMRGPRDFFMWRENMEDQLHRDQRPAFVP